MKTRKELTRAYDDRTLYPRLPDWVVDWIVYILATHAVIAGADYLDGIAVLPTEPSIYESVVPHVVWGITLAGGGFLTIAGLALSRWRAFLFGCLLLTTIYAGKAVAGGVWLLHVGWPPDAWRFVTIYLALALVWVLVAYGTRISLVAQTRDKETVKTAIDKR